MAPRNARTRRCEWTTWSYTAVAGEPPSPSSAAMKHLSSGRRTVRDDTPGVRSRPSGSRSRERPLDVALGAGREHRPVELGPLGGLVELERPTGQQVDQLLELRPIARRRRPLEAQRERLPHELRGAADPRRIL